jgi:hypothetical protein
MQLDSRQLQELPGRLQFISLRVYRDTDSSLRTATLKSKTRTKLVPSNLDCTSPVLEDTAILVSGALTVL